MKKQKSSLLVALFALLFILMCFNDSAALPDATEPTQITLATEVTLPAETLPEITEAPTQPVLEANGRYTTKEDVSLYIHIYGALPQNFMTKSEARALGWSGGGLDGYADGFCIGGDEFRNYEGQLPDAPGREYKECDINTLHASSRGPERLVYSNDGLIYYTPDHYDTFQLLYGEP